MTSATVPSELSIGERVDLDHGRLARLDVAELGLVDPGLDPHVLGIGKLEDRLALPHRDALIDLRLDAPPAVGLVDVDQHSVGRCPEGAVLDALLEAVESLCLELERGLLILPVRVDRLELGLERLEDLRSGELLEALEHAPRFSQRDRWLAGSPAHRPGAEKRSGSPSWPCRETTRGFASTAPPPPRRSGCTGG